MPPFPAFRNPMFAVQDSKTMPFGNCSTPRRLWLAVALLGLLSSGCRFMNRPAADAVPEVVAPPPLSPAPVEEHLVSLPTYIIEPPDILEINAVKVVPKSPYRIEALDYL